MIDLWWQIFLGLDCQKYLVDAYKLCLGFCFDRKGGASEELVKMNVNEGIILK